MKFELYTLIDITRTDARRGEDPVMYKKQQNYLTAMNTIGLRANPTIKKHPQIVTVHPNFGTAYKGKNTVWKLSFDIEYEDATSVELMQTDFNLIPVITGLDETVELQHQAFLTQDNQFFNIVFIRIE
jgi:hypothetical protein